MHDRIWSILPLYVSFHSASVIAPLSPGGIQCENGYAAEERVRVRVLEIPPAPAAAAENEGLPTPLVPPLRLGSLLRGELELSPVAPRRSTGYSDTFDFTEAFLDALRNLPSANDDYPDRLTTVIVTQTGALLGGLVGFRRLFVSVLAY